MEAEKEMKRWVNDYNVDERLLLGYTFAVPFQFEVVGSGVTAIKMQIPNGDYETRQEEKQKKLDIVSECIRGGEVGREVKDTVATQSYLLIHRVQEGEKTRYGLNWEINDRTIYLALMFPVWLLPSMVYRDSLSLNIHEGKRLLLITLGGRWARKTKKLHGRCDLWMRPFYSKLLCTREQCEDLGLNTNALNATFKDRLKGKLAEVTRKRLKMEKFERND